MEKASAPKVVTTVEALESRLPGEIREALGELVGRRGRGCSHSASVSASASCMNRWSDRSTWSLARRGSTTGIGRRSVTAARTGR